MVTLARAVHSAHERGIVHRDLKPANILLTPDGTPKVADFGIARTRTSAETEDPEMLLGTPGYMAPETITTPWAATHAVDVFALGAILHALVTGKAPFVGKDVTEVRTLDADVERSRSGLRGAGVLASSAFGLLLVFSGAMAISNGITKKRVPTRAGRV